MVHVKCKYNKIFKQKSRILIRPFLLTPTFIIGQTIEVGAYRLYNKDIFVGRKVGYIILSDCYRIFTFGLQFVPLPNTTST